MLLVVEMWLCEKLLDVVVDVDGGDDELLMIECLSEIVVCLNVFKKEVDVLLGLICLNDGVIVVDIVLLKCVLKLVALATIDFACRIVVDWVVECV